MRESNYTLALVVLVLVVIPQLFAAEKREFKTDKLVKSITERVRYLASDELAQADVLASFLPKALMEEEIKAKVDEII